MIPFRLQLKCILLFFVAACASPQKSETIKMSDGELAAYQSTLDTYTGGDKEYSGFYNTFEYRATLGNSKVRRAIIDRQADYFQWDSAKKSTELEKAAQEDRGATEIFISFFTPDRKNDNLADTKTIWRVFLDTEGRRYTGSVKKERRLLAELQTLYTYHTRWNSPYILKFDVPVSEIEKSGALLTITGPLGSKSVQFSP